MSGFFGASSGLPVGSKIEIFSKVVPKGFLLCDGSRVSKAQYAKLYNVIGDSFIRLVNEWGEPITQDTTKFYLPEFSGSVFVANGRKKYADLYQYLLGLPSDITTTYTTRYVATVNRTYSSPTYGTTLTHTLKTSGKHYFAIKLKNVLFNASELGQIIFDCVGGVGGNEGYQVSIELVKSGANTVFSNCKVYSNNVSIQNLSALNGMIANHQELVFFVDIGAKTGGFVVNGVTYNLVALSTQSLYQIRTTLFKSGATASLEIGYLPDSEIIEYNVQAAKAAGYKNIFELSDSEFVFNEKLGSDVHAHTIGATALTVPQLPTIAFNYDKVTASSGNYALIAYPPDTFAPLTTLTNTSTATNSIGSGQTHTHTLTNGSNLPPHITAMFAIKYK